MRSHHGTTVCVSEFGVTQPVRQRAMLQEAASGALTEILKRRLTALMLPWPHVELMLLLDGAAATYSSMPPGGSTSIIMRLEQV